MTCPHCGRDFILAEGQKYCAFCGGKLDASHAVPEPISEPSGPDFSAVDEMLADETGTPRSELREEYCPWEDQENLGFIQGIGRTLYESLFLPSTFFSRVPRQGGLLHPLLYALIVSTTGTMAAYLWAFATDNPLVEMIKGSGNSTLFVGLAVPIILFLSIFVWAGIVHMFLFFLGGARHDFEATFRVIAYSSGPELFNIVPFIGGYISLAWKLYLCMVGLREVHGTSTGRSLAALLLPGMGCLLSLLGVFWLLKFAADIPLK